MIQNDSKINEEQESKLKNKPSLEQSLDEII